MFELLSSSKRNLISSSQILFEAQQRSQLIQTWTVPKKITAISVVVIGNGGMSGAGLSWRNDIPVTPDETLTIQFDGIGGAATLLKRNNIILCAAGNGRIVTDLTKDTAINGGWGGKNYSGVNDGGGNGSAGYYIASSSIGVSQTGFAGGAGGYTGNGGNSARGVNTNGSAGTGGAGGGGAVSFVNGLMRSGTGGSVGNKGQGVSGAGGYGSLGGYLNGGTGSNGENVRYGRGHFYETARNSNSSQIYGGMACIRIIWQGNDGKTIRSFPAFAPDY
ncbi:TPA: hypothetical protein ACGAD2_004708 [Salmonella enterica subsp. enterica serovar Newport]